LSVRSNNSYRLLHGEFHQVFAHVSYYRASLGPPALAALRRYVRPVLWMTFIDVMFSRNGLMAHHVYF